MLLPKKFRVLLAALALIAAACSGSETDQNAAACGVVETSDDASSGESSEINGGKPIIEIPGGDAPSELVIDDLIPCDGATAESGDLLVMHYVGVLHEDGSEFDSSWDRGDTFSFVLGQGRVIQGWDEGIVGMTEGSRRQLTIPAAQAYGDNGAGAAIPPGASLIFVVDLVNAYSPHDVDLAVDNTDTLEVTELESGDGEELAEGDIVEVLFSIATESAGGVVQSSWTDGQTGRFVIGAESEQIFPGWGETLVGQNVGDVLRVVVPPESGPTPDGGEALITQLTVLGVLGSGQ